MVDLKIESKFRDESFSTQVEVHEKEVEGEGNDPSRMKNQKWGY